MAVEAGWYPDGSGLLRYWDGQAWTEHTHDPAAAPAEAAQEPAPVEPTPTEVLPVSAEPTPVTAVMPQATPAAMPAAVSPVTGGAPVATAPVTAPAARQGLSGGKVGALIGAGVLALAGIGLMLVPVLQGIGGGSGSAAQAPAASATPSDEATAGADDESDAAATDAADVTDDATEEPVDDAVSGDAVDPATLGTIDATSSAEDVAIAYAAAWYASDCPTEYGLSTDDAVWGATEDEYCGALEGMDGYVLVAAVVLDQETTADGTVVTLQESVDWGDDWVSDSTTAYTLVKTDNGWRVDSFTFVE